MSKFKNNILKKINNGNYSSINIEQYCPICDTLTNFKLYPDFRLVAGWDNNWPYQTRAAKCCACNTILELFMSTCKPKIIPYYETNIVEIKDE